MALQQIFEMYRGDDFTLKVHITDSNGMPVDITGWSFKSTMKLSTELDDTEAEVQVDIAAVSGPDAEAGVLYINYPHEQTKNLIPRTYVVDLQRELNGMVTTVFVGEALIKADVTHRSSV